MIYIFAKESSPRLRHVLNFAFAEKGEEFSLIHNADEWQQINGTKLNYSDNTLDCDYAIGPSGILYEDSVDPYLKLEFEKEKFLLRGYKDPLSIIFYLISCYEEYQKHEKDSHGRFNASQSVLTETGLIHRPFADELVKWLWKKLGLDYNRVQERFELVPSFDIDVAWAYKNRPLWRKIGAFSKGKIGERLAVLAGLKKDPYDTYSRIVEVSTKLNRIICFAPVSDYGPLDKNIAWTNENYRSLIRGLNASGGMGLHPGYHTFLNPEEIEVEKERLEEILGHEMTKCRFHFLRFELPKSYQQLMEIGFTKDYSMGFADHSGFRAGTSFPFHWYDLGKERSTNFLIFPFAYMDSALKDQMKLSATEACEVVEDLMIKVKDVGGVFMCVWHNHTINNKGKWKGWLDVLEHTVECARD